MNLSIMTIEQLEESQDEQIMPCIVYCLAVFIAGGYLVTQIAVPLAIILFILSCYGLTRECMKESAILDELELRYDAKDKQK